MDADYDQSVPVVTVNGNALTPDASGKYTIVDISANLTVAITGIVRNTTTGIEQVENATLIRAESGALLIRTPEKGCGLLLWHIGFRTVVRRNFLYAVADSAH